MEIRPFAADLPHQHDNGCETCNARGKLRDCDIPNEDIGRDRRPWQRIGTNTRTSAVAYAYTRGRTAIIGGTRGRAI
jgi:hypothetical protein